MHTLSKCTLLDFFHYGPDNVHLERSDCIIFRPASATDENANSIKFPINLLINLLTNCIVTFTH